MTVFAVDAVVVGGGHHGLVAAAVLADAGWDVLLLEAQPELGGAVRSTQWYPGFVADRFSAFYPVAAASPVFRALELERHGLRWAHAPAVLAHPMGSAAAVRSGSRCSTAAALPIGCARTAGACAHRRPCRSSSSARNTGEAAATG